MTKFDIEISIIKTIHSLFKSHLTLQVRTVYYVEYFVNSYEIYLADHFVQINRDSTQIKRCSFLNSKLRHGYFSSNITKFLKQLSLTLICLKWDLGDPSAIFLATSFVQKTPESSDFISSSILMLENIWYVDWIHEKFVNLEQNSQFLLN